MPIGMNRSFSVLQFPFPDYYCHLSPPINTSPMTSNSTPKYTLLQTQSHQQICLFPKLEDFFTLKSNIKKLTVFLFFIFLNQVKKNIGKIIQPFLEFLWYFCQNAKQIYETIVKSEQENHSQTIPSGEPLISVRYRV